MSSDDALPLDEWTFLIDGLRTGDDDVLSEFFHRYQPSLTRIVDRRVNPMLKRRFDADDVIQSTMRTFFRRAQTGQLEIDDDKRLWNLLCAITLTKLREKVRFHTRMRRAVQRDCDLDEGASKPAPGVDRATSGAASESDLEFEETFEAILASLPEDTREVIDLKLSGCSNSEIAARLDVSDRTIQRLFAKLQEKFEQALG